MAPHRSPGGQGSTPANEDVLDVIPSRAGGTHRLPPPPSALRGRVVVAAVAAGAVVAAVQTLQGGTAGATGFTPLANGEQMSTKVGVGGATLAPEVLPILKTTDPALEVQKLSQSDRIKAQLVKDTEQQAAARLPKFVRPAAGVFTSGFGSRWGQMHYGIDIANAIGTPILSAADGVVIEAGTATGFGLWVRVQHNDGTITVYGHVDKILCSEGQRVKAGEQIATMGNRGFSTGPHLHFEVWVGGKKINPLPWLNDRGIVL